MEPKVASPEPEPAATGPENEAPARQLSLRPRFGREARPRLARGAIALARRRLGRTTGARLGGAAGLLTAAAFTAVLVAARDPGSDAAGVGLVQTAARSIAWVVGVPLGLAAAHDRDALDRAEGIEALAAARGVPREALESARVLAAMSQATRAMGVPLVALTAVMAVFSVPSASIGARALVVVAAGIFALVAGMTVGGLAALCGRVGGGHGRSLLALVVLVPWLLADLAGRGAWSIPGALDAVLVGALRLAPGASP